MKKTGVLNAPLSELIASMGHTDKLVICDAGLPIPRGAEIVDLALTENMPPFLQTLEVILSELAVEEAIVAEEMPKVNGGVYEKVTDLLDGLRIRMVSHDEFKDIYREDAGIAFVRTGEVTPYANIILICGVTFG